MADKDEGRGRARLRRDSQQWAFDHAVAETGRVFHWQQAGRGRLPTSVKMHAMISKHVGKTAQRSERLGKAEADAGHANLRGSNAVQWHGDHHATTADWLRDRLGGAPVRYPGQTLYLEPNGVSPNDPSVPLKRHWFDGRGRG